MLCGFLRAAEAERRNNSENHTHMNEASSPKRRRDRRPTQQTEGSCDARRATRPGAYVAGHHGAS